MPGTVIMVYGKSWCGDTLRTRRFLETRSIPYEWCDIERDGEGRAFVLKCNRGNESVPTIVLPDGSILVEPSDADLADRLDSL